MRRKLLKFRGSDRSAKTGVDRTRLERHDDEITEPLDLDEISLDPVDGGREPGDPGSGSAFAAMLHQELAEPSVDEAEPPRPPIGRPGQTGRPGAVDESEPIMEAAMADHDLRAEMMTVGTAPDANPAADRGRSPASGSTPSESGPLTVEELFGLEAESASQGSNTVRPAPRSTVDSLGFWDRYDESVSASELFAVPPAAVTAVVGSLGVAMTVAEQCRASHWVSDCEVYVLTERPEQITQPTWHSLRRPSDVIAVLDSGESDFPLIVVDVPRELPAWVRPLMTRVREAGVGLVRYVLDDDPSDEDLATWHGELGRPSVLDLAAPIPPARVLELLDRGEPVASVGGMAITADLLLAMRVHA